MASCPARFDRSVSRGVPLFGPGRVQAAEDRVVVYEGELHLLSCTY